MADHLVGLDLSLAVSVYYRSHAYANYWERSYGKRDALNNSKAHSLASMAKYAPELQSISERVEVYQYVADNTGDSKLRETMLAGMADNAEGLSDPSKIVETCGHVACQSEDEILKEKALDVMDRHVEELPSALEKIKACYVTVGQTHNEGRAQRALRDIVKYSDELLPDVKEYILHLKYVIKNPNSDTDTRCLAATGINKYARALLHISEIRDAYLAVTDNLPDYFEPCKQAEANLRNLGKTNFPTDNKLISKSL